MPRSSKRLSSQSCGCGRNTASRNTRTDLISSHKISPDPKEHCKGAMHVKRGKESKVYIRVSSGDTKMSRPSTISCTLIDLIDAAVTWQTPLDTSQWLACTLRPGATLDAGSERSVVASVRAKVGYIAVSMTTSNRGVCFT